MAKHKLDLRENAIDSFNEALTKYRQGADGDAKAFKFAILHLAHSLELLFKYYVSKAHPLLIYKNPFSNRNLKKEPTIGLWDAVQFLANEGRPLEDDFLADLRWLKELRNDIEHYEFDMDLPTVRKTMGRLVQAINEFHEEVSDEDEIADFVSKGNQALFDELVDERIRQLANARQDAKELSEDGETYNCSACGYGNTVAREGEVFVCKYCDEVDRIIDCCICGDRVRESETVSWNDEFDDRACETCDDRIRNMD